MKSLALRLNLVTLALIAAVAGMALSQMPPSDAERHARVHHWIDRILQMDAQTEQDMLMLRTRQVVHYDDLTAHERRLSHALAELKQALDGVPGMNGAIEDLAGSIAIQREAIADFKAAIGVLLNSQRYLPTLARQLARTHPRKADLITRYNRDIFAWLLARDIPGLNDRLQREERALEAAGMTLLVGHGRIIRKQASEAMDAINTAANCGTPENTERVNLAYDAFHAQRMAARTTALMRLRWLAAALLGWLAAMLMALIQGSRKLRRANEELLQARQHLQQDITELEAARKRFTTLFDAIPDGVGVHRDGHWVMANPALLAMFGARRPEEVIGRPVRDFIHPDDREHEREVLARLKAGETIRHHRMRGLRLDGGVIHAEVSAMLFELDGKPAVLAAGRDIGERLRLMRRLETLAAAVESMGEGVMITDAEARIEYVNPAFEQITGYPAAEAVGRFASILRGNAHDEDFYREICRHLETGQPWSGRITIRRKDGREIVTERTITPVLDDQGRIARHVTLLWDITEDLVRQRKEAHDQRLKSLGVMAGGIAHDFNNMLAGIMGNAALGRMKLPPDNPARTYLERIETASKQAAALCRQMLDYSGQGEMESRPLNLARLVREVLDLVRVSISRKAELQIDLDDDLPPVMGDAGQLQQVVMNLVINASEALEGRPGTIAVRVGPADMDAESVRNSAFCYGAEDLSDGPFVALEVYDTGCGMDQATLERLFDPFFTTKFTGRGLGMSAVLGIVRAHHGAICVDSVKGSHTRFKVMLPCVAEAAAPSDGDEREAAAQQLSGTILVVDDEDIVREVAVEILESAGFHVLEARDGEEAVRIYREHGDGIDLVLLDMTMPKMDGHECLTELHRIDPDVRAVLASGYAEQDIEKQFADLPLAGIIKKPYDPDALIGLLRRALHTTESDKA